MSAHDPKRTSVDLHVERDVASRNANEAARQRLPALRAKNRFRSNGAGYFSGNSSESWARNCQFGAPLGFIAL
jgi:hypothetical protein